MPPGSFSTPKTKGTPTSLATSPNRGGSPNLKEISENTDLDTPEKMFLIKKWGSRVMNNVQDLCEQSWENLSSVLSSMCGLGDPEAKAIVNEIVQDVVVRKG